MEYEQINNELRVHQRNISDWGHRDALESLHKLADKMILEFKLQLPTPPALCVDRLRRAYGHYRYGRNAFGLRDEIAIDESHLRNDPFWQVVGTLLHELLHQWQDKYGQPGRRNYHNKAFRDKALSLGLKVDERGYTKYLAEDTPFVLFLRKVDLAPPVIPEPEVDCVAASKSKLKLYECVCIRPFKVRVARSDFKARCEYCGQVFKRKD